MLRQDIRALRLFAFVSLVHLYFFRVARQLAPLHSRLSSLTSANTPSALLNQLLIARAPARDPEILILDEALSNIDEAVQSSLLSSLRSAGMTIVICTHRPFTIALADRVIEVEGGRMAGL
jgi:predicted ABC-type transport system involved in lysophospholipase L1 biosynthesis ATPase subunit